MELKIKKVLPEAILPVYGTAGAACFDLHAANCGTITNTMPALIRTGLAFDIPEGYVMHIYSRSGHGFKHGVRLSNCVGVIDSDYVGEVMVRLTCDDPLGGFRVQPGDRIAQAMLVPVSQVSFVEVEELKETERGAGGFGSTGA